MWERNMNHLPPICTPTENKTHNLGTCLASLWCTGWWYNQVSHLALADFHFYTIVIKKHTWYNFNLKFVNTFIVAKIWSILENIPWVLEKNVNSAVIEWNILHMSVWSSCSTVKFKFIISFLALYDLSIVESRILKSFAIMTLLSISALKCVNNYLSYLVAPILHAYIYNCYIPSWLIDSFNVI